VHAIGVCLGLIGAITIVVMAVKIERIDVAPILVYVIGLVTMLAFSAAYKMWPVSPVKVGSASLRPLRDLFIDRRIHRSVPLTQTVPHA
jgi:predicted membrane channel-forming protein YqfA (hemolysin III family)